MTDDVMRELFHCLEIRLERCGVRLDSLEKTPVDFRADVRSRLEGLESYLARKADTWVVGLFGTLLVILLIAFQCLL